MTFAPSPFFFFLLWGWMEFWGSFPRRRSTGHADEDTPKTECAKTRPCAHAKEEFEECSERVRLWDEADEEERKKLGPHEDCVEECELLCSSLFAFKVYVSLPRPAEGVPAVSSVVRGLKRWGRQFLSTRTACRSVRRRSFSKRSSECNVSATVVHRAGLRLPHTPRRISKVRSNKCWKRTRYNERICILLVCWSRSGWAR